MSSKYLDQALLINSIAKMTISFNGIIAMTYVRPTVFRRRAANIRSTPYGLLKLGVDIGHKALNI